MIVKMIHRPYSGVPSGMVKIFYLVEEGEDRFQGSLERCLGPKEDGGLGT